jgi:hypothetical protein
MNRCTPNKHPYYYALSFPVNERVGTSELYETKWDSKNDNKRERERAKGMNERKMASYCSDSRFFRLLLEREKKKRK